MAIKLKPRNDRVVVQPDAEEEKSAGGIMLAPSASKDKPQQGTVIAVGPGKPIDTSTKDVAKMDLKPGMKVLFGKYSGTEVKVNDQDMLVLREDDIIAVVEDA